MVNAVQFQTCFTSTNASQGLLTVYWNTNEIGRLDEVVSSTNSQIVTARLPFATRSGVYTLSFRLDEFAGTTSRLVISNLSIGYIGVSESPSLSMSQTLGAGPALQLTGVAGYNYLIQRSTNLVDWTSESVITNATGSATFVVPTTTNDQRVFYRAFLP